jgi:NhaB family Na+:H+ antiporter
MSVVTIPVLVSGFLLCMVLEKFKICAYGANIPEPVYQILKDFDQTQNSNISIELKCKYIVQALGVAFLITALSLQWAEVGLIGLGLIVLMTSFNGVIEEHQIGESFKEALPFTALLIVFFTIVSMIHQQALFAPLIQYVLHLPAESQPSFLFVINGLLSMISDNVFVATVYISEVKAAYDAGDISREQFEHLAIAVNTGTNIPSVATPNGQAAFLFLLTSAVAPLIRLSYLKMVWMALPYTVVLSTVALIMVKFYV